MKTRFPARRPGSGFTLIEILVVVAIIGLMLTIGVPSFVRALHKEGMRKAQSDLLEACQKARGGAILKGAKQQLVFHPQSKSFEAPGEFPTTVLPDDVSFVSFSMNGWQIAPEDYETISVTFFPKGTSDDFAVVIRSERDGTLATITLDQVTALADISTSK